MFTLTIQRTETVLLLVRDVSLKNNLWEIKKMFNVKSNESSSHTELIDGSSFKDQPVEITPQSEP